jgi:hypothetical protein
MASVKNMIQCIVVMATQILMGCDEPQVATGTEGGYQQSCANEAVALTDTLPGQGRSVTTMQGS